MLFIIMSYAKLAPFFPMSYKLDDVNVSIKSSEYHAFHNNNFNLSKKQY